jgi:hypothetical protein
MTYSHKTIFDNVTQKQDSIAHSASSTVINLTTYFIPATTKPISIPNSSPRDEATESPFFLNHRRGKGWRSGESVGSTEGKAHESEDRTRVGHTCPTWVQRTGTFLGVTRQRREGCDTNPGIGVGWSGVLMAEPATGVGADGRRDDQRWRAGRSTRWCAARASRSAPTWHGRHISGEQRTGGEQLATESERTASP